MNAKFIGLNRNQPDSTVADISLQDMTNLRYQDGAWRPMGDKEESCYGEFNVFNPGDKEKYNTHANQPPIVHVMDGGIKNVLFFEKHPRFYDVIVYLIDPDGAELPVATLNALTVAYNGTFTYDKLRHFIFGKHIAILNDTKNTIAYLSWNGSSYDELPEIPDLPEIEMRAEKNAGEYASAIIGAESGAPSLVHADSLSNEEMKDRNAIAKYAEAAANKIRSEQGKLGNTDGYVFIICAYELFDGSFVKYSTPICINAGGVQGGDAISNLIYCQQSRVQIYPGLKKIYTCITSGWFAFKVNTTLDDKYSSLIKGLSIFMTPPVTINPTSCINSETDIEKTIVVKLEYPSSLYPSNNLDNMVNFYRVKSIPFEELTDSTYSDWSKIETDFNTITTNKALPVDSNSNHGLYPDKVFHYNNRLLFGKTTNKLALSHAGSKVSLVINNAKLDTSGNNGKIVLMACYPDLRATQITISNKQYTLRAHPYHNFSYVFTIKNENQLFGISVRYDEIQYPDDKNTIITSNPIPIPIYAVGSTKYTDENRVQASEVNNFYVFPLSNSYRVSNGSIVGFTANALPLSAGQFGAHPLFVFTTEGMYALSLGEDVFVSSILPLNGLVCTNPKRITQVDRATVFQTAEGLMLLQGSETTLISKPLEEYASNPLLDSALLNGVMAHARVGGYTSNAPISSISFEEYLSQANIGYDSYHREIIICKPKANYSYIYSLESNMWSKRSGSFDDIIHHYPDCYGTLNGKYLYQLNKEEYSAVQVFFQTRPVKISGGFKRLRRLLLRSYIETAGEVAGSEKLFGMYLLASIDGVKWRRVDSKEVYGKVRDIVHLSCPFSAQYFMLLAAGSIMPESYITSVDVDIEPADEKMR